MVEMRYGFGVNLKHGCNARTDAIAVLLLIGPVWDAAVCGDQRPHSRSTASAMSVALQW